MEDIFKTKNKVSSVEESWGPELDITAEEILLRR